MDWRGFMGTWEDIFKAEGLVFHKWQEDMDNIIRFFKKKKVKKVLDLGCGSGRHTVLLAKHGFDVYGTDVSDSALKLTREWLKKEELKARLIKDSCYSKFPFPDKYFDAVISLQVIHHNYHKKIQYCIGEIERVLKPDGLIFVTVSASRYKQRATKFAMPKPRIYVPLDGDEKGLPHYIYNKPLLRKDFGHFQILDIHMDKGKHYCLFGVLKK